MGSSTTEEKKSVRLLRRCRGPLLLLAAGVVPL